MSKRIQNLIVGDKVNLFLNEYFTSIFLTKRVPEFLNSTQIDDAMRSIFVIMVF